MWRQARRDAPVHKWIEERHAIHGSELDEELPALDDHQDDSTFDFNFKSLNKVFQRTLFEFHDGHR